MDAKKRSLITTQPILYDDDGYCNLSKNSPLHNDIARTESRGGFNIKHSTSHESSKIITVENQLVMIDLDSKFS